MKTLFISTLMMLAFGFSSHAQNLITVQNGSKAQFYTSLDSAYVHSADGDTIYVPGGSYSSPGEINKSIHIIGVGHNPDSTSATNFTLINGSIDLRQGASNGSLTGVYLIGSLSLTDTIYNYSVERSNVYAISFSSAFPHNNSFKDNIIKTLNGHSMVDNQSNNIYLNNIINGFNYHFSGDIFKNNIFLVDYGTYTSPFTSVIFENNIFVPAIGPDMNFTNCILNNNFFVDDTNLLGNPQGNILNSNINNQPLSSLFIKYSARDGFQYTDNYHLKSGSPGKNAGKDGTDIGIYGGVFPWKVGSVPFNPHIISSTIANKTNSDGTLHVSIKVEAQHR